MNASSKVSSVVLSLVEAVVGILLLVNPVGFTRGILIVLGIVLLAAGLISIIQYFRERPGKAALEQGLTRGLLSVTVGLVFIIKNQWLIDLFPLLTVLYGIGLLVLGLAKVQWTVDKIRLKIGQWFWAAISAVLTLACAVIILLNPFTTTEVLWIFIGVTLIVEAVVDIIVTIFSKKQNPDGGSASNKA